MSDCHGVVQQGKERSQESGLDLLKIADSITKQGPPRDTFWVDRLHSCGLLYNLSLSACWKFLCVEKVVGIPPVIR